MAFTMQVPDEAEIKKEVLEQVKPASKDLAQLQAQAERNVADLLTLDTDEFAKKKEILQSIESFGADSMKRSAAKNSLLHITVGELSRKGDDEGLVARGLMDLNRMLKDLDPSLIDFTKTGLLGKLFDPVRAYFAKCQSAESAIEDINVSLNEGKKALEYDNKTLQFEQQAMRDLTRKLMKEVQLGILMDGAIEKQIDAARARNEDREKIKFVCEEVQFPLRQRIMDMQQVIVVNQQGVMATEIVIKNNKELMRGVEKAQNVTTNALRIAITIASALYNQEKAQKKIDILNKFTSDILTLNSKKLKEQGATIQRQSMQANISPETLKAAFADAMEALDSISTYKQEALPAMRKTIEDFRVLAARGEEQIDKLEKGQKLGL